ncbi:MAG: hypothetical protein ABR909_08740 [Candidatus Bathyarchaeia archaeon]|jgi:uncharacterized protein (UPF0332 family)
MIERFQYYLDAKLVRKEKVDKEEAKSLMKKAVYRLNYVKKQEINEDTASFIFEDVYESLREASQSLMSLKGYKPYSHEALISFLKEFYNFSASEISTFDRFRALRNKTVYCAVFVSVEVCQEALDFLEDFLPKLRREFESSNV